MKKSLLFLLIVSFIFISACVTVEDKESIRESKIITQEQPEIDITKTKGLGKLCSSLVDCFAFCKGNSGRCINFCRKNPSHELCKVEPAKPQEWVKDAITQPLPEGSSKVRLVLYAPLDAIPLKEVGAYGAHRSSHSEGLDHEWIPVKQGVLMTSWADGYVVWARPDPGDAGYEEGMMNVVIYYGDGLWGEHMGLDRNKVLVKEGQTVKANEPIGYGPVLDYNSTYQFGEFTVADQHRREGVFYWYKFIRGGNLVSPFDYLQDDIKQQLEEKWQKEVIEAYLLKGEDIFGVVATPWEPYLTNPILLHSGHKGGLIGEWYLRSKEWAIDNIPDMLVFFTNNTKYYNKQRIIGAEEDSGQTILSGDWAADYKNNRIIINANNEIYYGIFEINESEAQAKLKIEYQKDSHPTAFSENARIYTERLKLSKSNERFYWKPENMQYIHVEDVLYNQD